MTSIAVSHRSETSPLSFVLVALKGLRRRQIDALQRKRLLGLDDHMLLLSLDHHVLRDIGLERLKAN
ncbi:MAG: hypothetical protein ABIU05_27570 [Nitrospirales bacterium]